MKQIKEWLSDKYHWLKTFNKKPQVDLNGTIICVLGEPKNIVVKGRLVLNMNADLFAIESLDEITLELVEKIKEIKFNKKKQP